MPVEGVEAYPLYWPEDWPRAEHRSTAAYKVEFGKARDDVIRSMRCMGVRISDLVISTNVPLRRDGLPLSGMREPDDPGVAVYWVRGDKPFVIACDRWNRVKANVRAVWHALEGLRAIERCGATHVIERAFMGFSALPANAMMSPQQWRTVLGLPKTGRLTLAAVETAYRAEAARAHPDRGGSHDRMVAVNAAREAALQELNA